MGDALEVFLEERCGALCLDSKGDRERLVQLLWEFARDNPYYIDALVDERLEVKGWLVRGQSSGLLQVGHRAFQEAIMVQDAVNPVAIVRALHHAVRAVFKESNELSHGTTWITNHPVMVLFVSKLASLCRPDDTGVFSAAYKACMEARRG